MRRLLPVLIVFAALLAIGAPAALAHDGGQGLLGETDDKIVTDAGFILIIFFPVFVTLMSRLQRRLDKRKSERKKAHSASAQWRGGW